MLRYVPSGPASLSSDAPGWTHRRRREAAEEDDGEEEEGRAENARSAGKEDDDGSVHGGDGSSSSIGDNEGGTKEGEEEGGSAAGREGARRPPPPPPPPGGGPTCWKCRGSGLVKEKKDKTKKKKKRPRPSSEEDARDESTATDTATPHVPAPPTTKPESEAAEKRRRSCPVCAGSGSLPPKAKSSPEGARNILPMITRARRQPTRDWKVGGPEADAVRRMRNLTTAAARARRGEGAEDEDSDAEAEALELLRRASVPVGEWQRADANAEGKTTDKGGTGGQNSEENDAGVIIPIPPSSSSSAPVAHSVQYPPWVPSSPGEQLCNLVGDWRILQRVGSHRWTTDDLVTAYVAGRVARGLTLPGQHCFETSASSAVANAEDGDASEEGRAFRYLDLGTGNGSVLQMTSWSLLESHPQFRGYGVEARGEAVGLARRSLAFNVGDDAAAMTETERGGGATGEEEAPRRRRLGVVRADFRDLATTEDANGGGKTTDHGSNNDEGTIDDEDGNARLLNEIRSDKFDLITGTPPYFQVDFVPSSGEDGDSSGRPKREEEAGSATGAAETSSAAEMATAKMASAPPTAAVIVQGGMPTSVQSAPARCEFRGGVEAYCAAASSLLKSESESEGGGNLVVCVNWPNDRRVYDGAERSGMVVRTVLPVKGKAGRRENLFGVYVLRRKSVDGPNDGGRGGCDDGEGKDKGKNGTTTEILPPLAVRDDRGEWTEEYAKVLRDMSIPVP